VMSVCLSEHHQLTLQQIKISQWHFYGIRLRSNEL